MTDRSILGAQAETFVAQSLEKKGFKIVERNYKKVYGEIDLIALKDKLLLFIEVKMRSNTYFDLAQVITPSKQKKIINTASMYIEQHKYYDKDCRFDVALVELQNEQLQLTYLADAFTG